MYISVVSIIIIIITINLTNWKKKAALINAYMHIFNRLLSLFSFLFIESCLFIVLELYSFSKLHIITIKMLVLARRNTKE